jgi:hypothetical protein
MSAVRGILEPTMEDMMKQLSRSFRFDAGMFAAILLAVLMAACIKVNVQCAPGGQGGQDDGGAPGACSPMSYQGTAAGFYNTATSSTIPTPTTLVCVSSTKCKPIAGKCGFTQTPCKSTFTPTTGNEGTCSCGCP